VAAIAGSAQGVDPEALQLVVIDQTGAIVALLPVALDVRTGLWSTTIDAEAAFLQDAALTVQIVAAFPTGGRPLTDRIPLFIQRNDSLLTGAVTYLQRMALPPDSVVKVRIVNTSLADAPPEMVLLAEQVIRNAVGSPIPFAVPFSSADVDERALYSVGARVEDGDGKLLFASTTANPVITRGNPTSDVEVRVTQTP
jgi:putative lipoprotein